MPRPRPLPPAADHRQHDPLLVAQLAAGDPLDEEQTREAQHLVSACADCAALAEDLRAVSAAVAWEPLPPRRRDFRIAPEQAERLEGNALTRLLRGLSLPRSAAFRPAAAGILSLGLAFVVVGYAWPDGGSVTVEGEPAVVPAAVEDVVPPAVEDVVLPAAEERAVSTMPAPVEERAVSTMPPFEDILRSQAGAPMDEAEFFATEPSAEDTEPSSQEAEPFIEGFAPSTEDAEDADAALLQQKSGTQRAGEDYEAGLADDAAAGAAPQAPADESNVELERERVIGEVAEPDAAVGDDLGMDGLGAAVEADDAAAVTEAADEVPAAAVEPADEIETAPVETAVQDAVADDDGIAVASILLVVGLGLAALGGAALLLAWLARRVSDPLLR